MRNPYREIFSLPGTKGFSLAALLGRMPFSMTGIGIITLFSQLRGAYALAAAVAAVFAFAMAICGPLVARLVDRHGQGKVLPIAAAVSASAMLTLVLLARADAPAWTLFVSAAVAGCLPSMSAMVRARWTALYRDKPQLRTAYAFESVLDEASIIIGAPLAISLSVGWFPEAGVLTALVLQIIGVGGFVLQRRTEPPVRLALADGGVSPIRMLPIQLLLLLLLAMGTIVGAIDVVSVAFAADEGLPAGAAVVLSAYAVGSCLAGLLFGALKLKASLPKQLLYFGIGTAVSTLPLIFVGDITTLAIAMFISGVFFAPTMIVAMASVEIVVPSDKLTEGFTWLISGLGVGMAVGAAAAGQVVDSVGTRTGFSVVLAAALLTAVIVVFGHRHIASSSRASRLLSGLAADAASHPSAGSAVIPEPVQKN